MPPSWSTNRLFKAAVSIFPYLAPLRTWSFPRHTFRPSFFARLVFIGPFASRRASSLPVAASHTRAVLSHDAVTMRALSGLHDRAGRPPSTSRSSPPVRAGGTSSGDSIAERERLVRETAEAAQREAAQARKVARRTLAGLVAAMFCAVVAGGLAWQRRQVAERKAGYSKITLGVVSTTRSCKSTDQICSANARSTTRADDDRCSCGQNRAIQKAEWQRRTH